MDGTNALLAAVVGLLLRFGLPLLVTAAAVLWLRRLDMRWQAEAQGLPRRVATVAAVAPCWETRNCPPERMADCPARARLDVPCWQLFRDESGRLREACLDCQVFKAAPIPAFA